MLAVVKSRRRYCAAVIAEDDIGSARTLEVTTADGPMLLYEAEPKGGESRRAVVVLEEIFGVNEYIEDVTRRFAAVGYHGVAPELFHRTGGGPIPYDRYDLARPQAAALTDSGLLTDLDATLEHLAGAGFASERIGIVGFCLGGRVSFLAACERRFGAAVGLYGGGILKGRGEGQAPLGPRISTMSTPYLGLFGDDDASIPVEEVEELRRALEESPVTTEIVRYAGAGHGFHNDRRDSFVSAAAEDAFERTLEFFDRFLA